MKLKNLLILIGLCLLVSNVLAVDYASVYPSLDVDHVKVTNYLDSNYYPHLACDPSKILTGTHTGTSWLTGIGVVNYQKFCIAYNESFIVKRIYIENFHTSGASTDMGVNGFALYGTNTESLFHDVNYTDFDLWTEITASNWSAHTGDDIVDPAYIETTSNTNAFQYYCFRFINNHGNAERMGIRRIVLQEYNLSSVFYAADTTIALGNTATFYNTSTGALTAMQWSFGDGCYASDISAVGHVYNTTGTFAVSLNVTDGSSYDISTHMVHIGIPPILNFTATPIFDRYPLNATFIGGNIGNVSANSTYIWTFGDGKYATGTLSQFHVYNTTGLFDVNLSSTNDYGTNFSYQSGYLTAIFLNASFVAFPSMTTGEVQFYDNSTGTGTPTSWNWSSTDGWTSSSQNPSYTYSNTGRFNVSLTACNSTVSNTSTISPGVYVLPNILNLSGCTGDTARTTNGYIENSYWGIYAEIPTTAASAEFDTAVTRTGSETLKLSTTDATGAIQGIYGGEVDNMTLSVLPNSYYHFSVYAKTNNVASESVYMRVLEYDSDESYITNTDSSPLSGTSDWAELTSSFTTQANTRYIRILFRNYVAGNVGDAWFDVNGLTVSTLNADFTSDKVNSLVHTSVQFYDNSTGTPTEWHWGFGDGGNSTSQDPSYSYHTSGTYNVNLNISDGLTVSTKTVPNYITVYDPATSQFSANITSGAPPLTISFTFSGANATSWYWTFGDGNTSTLENPTHTYAMNGTFTVACNASNPVSYDIESKTGYISTQYPPIAQFNASPIYASPSTNVQFIDMSGVSIVSWVWSFGDSCYAPSQNPIHQYNSSGDYEVSLYVTNIGGSDTETKPSFIHIGLPPVADFTGDPLTARYGPMEVQFTDTSTNTPTLWNWTFGDGSSSTEQNPTNTYTIGGLYNVSLTVSNAFGSDSETKTDYIDSPYQQERAKATATIARISEAGAEAIIGAIGTDPYTSDKGFNIVEIGEAAYETYDDAIPYHLASLMIFAGIFASLYYITGRVEPSLAIGIVFGVWIIARLPADYQHIGGILIAVSVVGVVFKLMIDRKWI